MGHKLKSSVVDSRPSVCSQVMMLGSRLLMPWSMSLEEESTKVN